MKQIYAPGCAFMLYKPELSKKVFKFLNKNLGNIPEQLICCRNKPKLESGTQVINACAGCDQRYRELYDNISTISLWEILAESNTFPFPDYNGIKMSIHDACSTRTEERVHSAIRRLLERMNIEIIEPKNTRTKAICCGYSFYDTLSPEQVNKMIEKRSSEMPCDNVVVYCFSCIKSIHIGRKKPRHIIDLLFGEETMVSILESDTWEDKLSEFINSHLSDEK
ncbi:(Fe-S)-binding protein [Clostridium sp.]|uniref:(Fe-S)-binding protein n=1 Tax=Clostridium sp. TaxID=1506 RepID=UPI00284EAC04|nr:(Fe-S)-binding protein [Clostridium sp.]MDR3595666.1 (Fe-S)-binding protein [Clostridium sp.]